ncbi:MAG: alpha/beta fold hydrolase [Lachnospiraceae bacterium]|nr:alpha/beta fold hydrolase [Lachnospiraceae bacterium]
MLDEVIMKKEEMRISHHGRESYGVFCKPEKKDKYPIVIFSHGYNGSGIWAEPYAQYLTERGIGVFYHDFCGGSVHSKSSMKTTEMTLFTEEEDLLAVFNEISTWSCTDKDNIFLWGESQGGLISAMAVNNLGSRVRGLILVYPAFCIANDWRKKFPEISEIPEKVEFQGMTLGRKFFTSIHEFDAFQNIGCYKGKVLIIHGDKDPVVSFEYSRKAASRYQNASLHILKEEGHGFTKEGKEKTLVLAYDMIRLDNSDLQ